MNNSFRNSSSGSSRARVVFFGTPEVALPSLIKLHQDLSFQIVAVVTQPDQPRGRGLMVQAPMVKEYALSHHLDVFQPARPGEIMKHLSALQADFFVVVSYGMILPQAVLDLPRFGTYNLHFSVLPKYRGAAPMQATLLAGDKVSGVSVIKMARELDAGDIVGVREYQVADDADYARLEADMSEIGSELLIMSLELVRSGQAVFCAQNSQLATCCRKVSRHDGKIYWHTYDAVEIDRQIRAFSNWPGCFCLWKGKRLKILQAKAAHAEKTYGTAGTVIKFGEVTGICARQGLVSPEVVQLEGKKEMLFQDFLRGYPDFIGSMLES